MEKAECPLWLKDEKSILLLFLLLLLLLHILIKSVMQKLWNEINHKNFIHSFLRILINAWKDLN